MSFPRRTVLGGMSAAFALQACGLDAQAKKPRIGVIGGGLIGASVALQLAKAGAEVIVFEKARPAGGATEKSVAWINPVVNDAHYMKLRLESMAAWLEDDSAYGMKAIWGGSISWAYENKREALQTKATLLEATDDPPRYLTAKQITEVAPGVFPGDGVKLAFLTHKDGHVDPVHATERYLAAAARLGTRVIHPCEVTAIRVRDGAVVGVDTTKGPHDLDQLVCVAGTDTPRIMEMVGRKFELKHKPGLVIHTRPRPVTTPHVFEASSILEFKQYADGRYLTSFTSGPPDLPQHAEILKEQMDYPDDYLRSRHGEILIERTAMYMPAIAGSEVDKVLLGFRPYPLDNRPVAGPVPGVHGMYMVVTHSGITLAPILGRYAAKEIMTGAEASLLSPYRPSRYIAA